MVSNEEKAQRLALAKRENEQRLDKRKRTARMSTAAPQHLPSMTDTKNSSDSDSSEPEAKRRRDITDDELEELHDRMTSLLVRMRSLEREVRDIGKIIEKLVSSRHQD
jgi:hypothetical protein